MSVHSPIVRVSLKPDTSGLWCVPGGAASFPPGACAFHQREGDILDLYAILRLSGDLANS